MRVRLIAIGTKPPDWARAACAEYLARLKPRLKLEVLELPAAKRQNEGADARAARDEGERLVAALQPGEHVVALDESGREYSTREFATWLGARRQSGEDVAFLIGGADGFTTDVLARAHQRCSLSRLTLPHALARVVFIEQLYRATLVLEGHPYHREGKPGGSAARGAAKAVARKGRRG